MPKKAMTEAEALHFLTGNNTGHLATVDADGTPYIVPLNYIFYNGGIYFHCAHNGKKLDNIKRHDKVCFEVSRTDKTYLGDKPCNCATRYTSIIAQGRAQVVEDKEEKIKALNALTENFATGRLHGQVDETMAATCTVVRIEIASLTGKRNVDPD
ncbi:MAG: pyridoxamine 5'-phosphate oxidase family protein [Negativicutes bacterium]|nr:pyridoxamine 5'-phosphate oxidase family protein [Negativicutes bacterium]